MLIESRLDFCLGDLEEQGWSLVQHEDGYSELYAPSGWAFNSEIELQVDDINDPEVTDEMKEELRGEEIRAGLVFDCLRSWR